MLPDRVSNPGPLTYESGALPIVLHGPAFFQELAPFKKGEKLKISQLLLLRVQSFTVQHKTTVYNQA